MKDTHKFPWAANHSWKAWKGYYANHSTELEKEMKIIASFTPDKFKDGHGKIVAYQRASSISSIDLPSSSSSSSSDEMDGVQGNYANQLFIGFC